MTARKTTASVAARHRAPTRKASPARPKATAAAAGAAPTKTAAADKTSKPGKRHKPVRDSFTMPPADFALIGTLKERALAGKRAAKKSELLRAGLHALAQLDSAALVAALGRLAPVKVGRPKKG
jgi:hypothetical protein